MPNIGKNIGIDPHIWKDYVVRIARENDIPCNESITSFNGNFMAFDENKVLVYYNRNSVQFNDLGLFVAVLEKEKISTLKLEDILDHRRDTLAREGRSVGFERPEEGVEAVPRAGWTVRLYIQEKYLGEFRKNISEI